MDRGKLFVIEGTDGSGKATQTKLLVDRLRSEGTPVQTMSFPRYDTPTGRIIGGPYLGKSHISECWWSEGSDSVDPEIACLYYAADRAAARKEINESLQEGTHIILDRYTWSNMAHQGGKMREPSKRMALFEYIERLEFGLLHIPRPDATVFLYVPARVSEGLRERRGQASDGHEGNPDHMRRAEDTYVQLAAQYGWRKIDCLREGTLRPPHDIHEDVFTFFKSLRT